jgi:hypothetical protein
MSVAQPISGYSMLTRRHLVIASLLAGINAAAAQTPSPGDPVSILTAIYTRAAKGKGDGGGAFIIENKAAKARYLSRSLVALWAKADAHTPKGDVGPVDFDPVTNSQEPDVKSFKVDPEKLEVDKATVTVAIAGHRNGRKPVDQIIRYEFVREANAWKIDDIKGSSDGEAWSIRSMLIGSLKN